MDLAASHINFPQHWDYLEDQYQALSNLVYNKGERASLYPPCQSLGPFKWNSTDHWCQKQRHNFHLCSQIQRIYLILLYIILYLNTPISKLWCDGSRAQRRLMMGIVWRQFPLWFNYVNSTALGTTFAFWMQSAGDDEDAGGNKAAGVEIVDFCCFYLVKFLSVWWDASRHAHCERWFWQ